jgi:hypothetical protein
MESSDELSVMVLYLRASSQRGGTRMPKTKKSKKTTDNMEKPQHQTTRREVLKKAIFVAPAILTLPALPSFASAGSQPGEDNTTGPTNAVLSQPGDVPVAVEFEMRVAEEQRE